MARPGKGQGMTLLELMFSIFVASVLLTIAVPSFDWLFEKERLRGAASRLAMETRQARAEAQVSGEPVTVTVVAGEAWCMGLSDAGACDCTAQGACRIQDIPKAVDGENFEGITVRGRDLATTFNPSYRNLPRPSRHEWPILLESDSGKRLGVHLTVLGDAYVCAPAGMEETWDYPECL